MAMPRGCRNGGACCHRSSHPVVPRTRSSQTFGPGAGLRTDAWTPSVDGWVDEKLGSDRSSAQILSGPRLGIAATDWLSQQPSADLMGSKKVL
jgi:hypothetical protein